MFQRSITPLEVNKIKLPNQSHFTGNLIYEGVNVVGGVSIGITKHHQCDNPVTSLVKELIFNEEFSLGAN